MTENSRENRKQLDISTEVHYRLKVYSVTNNFKNLALAIESLLDHYEKVKK